MAVVYLLGDSKIYHKRNENQKVTYVLEFKVLDGLLFLNILKLKYSLKSHYTLQHVSEEKNFGMRK